MDLTWSGSATLELRGVVKIIQYMYIWENCWEYELLREDVYCVRMSWLYVWKHENVSDASDWLKDPKNSINFYIFKDMNHDIFGI